MDRGYTTNTSIFSSKNTKLKDICNYWLQDVKKVSVKPKTFQKYDSTLRLYILPLLGEIKITAITPQQVQTVLNNWSNGTLKGKKDMSYLPVPYVVLDVIFQNYLSMQ